MPSLFPSPLFVYSAFLSLPPFVAFSFSSLLRPCPFLPLWASSHCFHSPPPPPTTRGFKVRFSPCRLLCSVGLWVLLYGSMGLCPSPLHNIFRPFLSTRICLLPQQLPCPTHLRLGGERLQGHPGWEGCRASAMARFEDAFDGSNLGVHGVIRTSERGHWAGGTAGFPLGAGQGRRLHTQPSLQAFKPQIYP